VSRPAVSAAAAQHKQQQRSIRHRAMLQQQQQQQQQQQHMQAAGRSGVQPPHMYPSMDLEQDTRSSEEVFKRMLLLFLRRYGVCYYLCHCYYCFCQHSSTITAASCTSAVAAAATVVIQRLLSMAALHARHPYVTCTLSHTSPSSLHAVHGTQHNRAMCTD
jgi:hypothetical protein